LPEAIGADRDAGAEEAEHRADARAMKQRNRQPGSGEKDKHVLQPGPVVQCVPLSLRRQRTSSFGFALPKCKFRSHDVKQP
jgi:hypothetical protein